MIQDIIGINVYTDNLERMTRFYRDILGINLRSSHDSAVVFELRPGMRLNIGMHTSVQGPSKDSFRMMINFETLDIHSSYTELNARGAHFIRRPEQESWGGWVATLQDPDGNTLQLLQTTK
ncbi:VOC family protein [Dehalococcoidia bacterium]|nr:VOC family protein [Dehalococcoidia bacterium]